MPWFAAIFLMFTMANVGLPGTSGFIGEILTMTGVYGVSTWTALFAASGVIFSAVYALTLYRNVMFGEITNPAMKTITDIDKRELLIFVAADHRHPVAGRAARSGAGLHRRLGRGPDFRLSTCDRRVRP
jgi:NADH:ubiquinone oxidoreductase subunit 4 (subunit M)